MLFCSLSFHCNIDEMLQEPNSCFYQLAYGRIGFAVILFRLKSQNLLTTLIEDLLHICALYLARENVRSSGISSIIALYCYFNFLTHLFMNQSSECFRDYAVQFPFYKPRPQEGSDFPKGSDAYWQNLGQDSKLPTLSTSPSVQYSFHHIFNVSLTASPIRMDIRCLQRSLLFSIFPTAASKPSKVPCTQSQHSINICRFHFMKYSASYFISWVQHSAGNWAALLQSISHRVNPSHHHTHCPYLLQGQ